MSSVTPLRVVAPKVSKTALEMAEAILARVKSGETIGLAVVEETRTGVSTGWVKGTSVHYLTSGAATLAARLALHDDV